MNEGERISAEMLLAQIDIEATASKNQILDLLPPGWLKEYVAYTQISEAPDTFHLFCAVAVLSHLVGRRMWFGLGLKTLYAPLSVFLISPAGAAKRSTAIDAAVRTGRMAGAEVLQDMMTPEGLLDWLLARPQSLVVADEAASLLSRSDYMAAMPQVLCTLLDCPNVYERKLRGSYMRVIEPTVNALIGCAPEWILTSMPASALKGGLFSRLVIVYEPKRKKLLALPDDEVDYETSHAMGEQMGRRLAEASAASPAGKMVYTQQAKTAFRKWYQENDDAINAADDKMAVYLGRKPDHVHRIVMALIASGGLPLEAGEDLLQTALGILAYIEPNMGYVYEHAGLEKTGQVNHKILAIIARHGGRMTRSDLLRASHLSKKELAETVDSLVEAGILGQKLMQTADDRKPTTVYETVRTNGKA